VAPSRLGSVKKRLRL